jgi:hypothetical protein
MKKLCSLLLAVGVVIAFAQPGFSQVERMADNDAQVPGAVRVGADEATAIVDAVDYENRTGTIRLPDGTTLSFKAWPELRNFDRVKVGDKVFIRK